MASISFNQLTQIRKNIGKKKLKKPAKWLFPYNLEREYRRLLHKFVKQISIEINNQLKPAIPQMLSEVESTYPKTDSTRNDDFLSLLRNILLSIDESLKPHLEETILQMIILGSQISDFNYNQFQKVNHSVFGIDIFIDEPYLRDQLELFARQNTQLITSIPEQELLQVAGIVERGLVQGSRFTSIATDLQKRFSITRRRANLISRDQTTKLNASLTRLRQEDVGIEEYIWQTSGDERVRPTHRAHDGKRFRWDKPPPDTGHPGTDINCRCVALPVMEGIFD